MLGDDFLQDLGGVERDLVLCVRSFRRVKPGSEEYLRRVNQLEVLREILTYG